MGHHGVVHVSQRPRRAATEVFIPVSDLKKPPNKPTTRKQARAGKRTLLCSVPTAAQRASAETASHKEAGRAWSTPS